MGEHISQVMTKEPYVVSPEKPLTRVVHDMIETGHKSFPVVENDRLVGIVAREDIIRALRKAAQGQGPDRDG
jgi:CBS domain-containing protein